jgi:cell division control protein 24
VTKVVNQVLDILVQRGILDASLGATTPSAESTTGVVAKKTKRQHIVAELVNTERTYVQHLELLQAFRVLVEEKGVIGGDAIHDIFFNLNALLDFQRRFLIRVEQTNLANEDEQDWGDLFVGSKDAFKVYEQYIANQSKCEAAALREFNKLREVGGPPELQQFTENPTVLSAFLLKPFQRLSKYPLLLRVWSLSCLFFYCR